MNSTVKNRRPFLFSILKRTHPKEKKKKTQRTEKKCSIKLFSYKSKKAATSTKCENLDKIFSDKHNINNYCILSFFNYL